MIGGGISGRAFEGRLHQHRWAVGMSYELMSQHRHPMRPPTVDFLSDPSSDQRDPRWLRPSRLEPVATARKSVAAGRRDVVILGSTGSVGSQALDLVRTHSDRFRLVGLTAGGAREKLFRQQVAEFTPAFAGLGAESSVQAASMPCDVVLNAIVGAAGLPPTLAALAAGTTLALANKESLVMGGPIIARLARPGQIVPVDSEHSAIAQCLRAGSPDEVARLVLTTSGGPFRGIPRSELFAVTPAQAQNHPNFAMGPALATSSATLVNKGLEVIEAYLLFGLPLERIDVVIHPQQIVHSMVEFVDGSTIAQVGRPTMRIPISLGLGWPERTPRAGQPMDWRIPMQWQFEPLDATSSAAIDLARCAARLGGTAPAVYNAANEAAVDAFHTGHLRFLDIVPTIEHVMGNHTQPHIEELTLEAVMSADAWARRQVAARVSA